MTLILALAALILAALGVLALGIAAVFVYRARYWSEERTYWAEHAQRLDGDTLGTEP